MNNMSKSSLKYEGKAKRIYQWDDPQYYRMEFKDATTAFDGEKKEDIVGKGRLNHQISVMMFEFLAARGVKTHFVRSLSDHEMLVRALDIVPVEVVVRNITFGSLCRRLGLEERKPLDPPLVEFFLKNDELHDPLITDDHVLMMGLATVEEMAIFRRVALQVNELMRDFFKQLDIVLVDFKLEFGRDLHGELFLADEITPDGCRLWDAYTQESMDKDRFRKNLGGLKEAYEQVLARIKKGVS